MWIRNKAVRITLELGLWILFCSIPVLFMPKHFGHRPESQDVFSYFISFFILKNIKFVFLFYVNYKWLIPRFLSQKKYLQYSLTLAACFLLVIAWPWIIHLLQPHEGPPPHWPPPHMHPHPEPGPHPHHRPMFKPDVGMHFFMSIIVLLVPLLMYSFNNWIKSVSEKNQMELRFLKSQINHHFLFNSLNTIYALSESGSPETSKAIFSLSTMMRYLLSDSQSDKVTLTKELELISHYIELQRLRLPSNMILHFQVKGEVPPYSISPMILMTFIENCFKHGIHTNKPGEINIDIHLLNNKIILDTKNEIHATNQSLDAIEGIGVENAKRRLAHDYPNKYQLQLKEEAPYFYLHLEIDLI